MESIPNLNDSVEFLISPSATDEQIRDILTDMLIRLPQGNAQDRNIIRTLLDLIQDPDGTNILPPEFRKRLDRLMGEVLAR